MFYIAEHAGPSVCSAFSVSERGESDEQEARAHYSEKVDKAGV